MEFNIRENAMRLLAYLCDKSDASLKVHDLNIEDIIPDHTQRWKCKLYIVKKKYTSDFKDEKHPELKTISCEIYAEGIDAVDDYFKGRV